MPDRYPEVLAELARLIHDRLLTRLGDDAGPAAMEVVEAIRRGFGGEMIYIPLASPHKRQHRNEAICRQFDGRNHRDLAHQYGVSVKTIYGILSSHRARRQSILFE